MAEGLAVAASVAGLLSLGIQVTESILNFYDAYSDQNSEMLKTTDNFQKTLNTLRVLDAALRSRHFHADERELLQEIEFSIKNCEDAIGDLKLESEKLRNGPQNDFKTRIQVAGRRAAYPFRRSTIQKLQEDMSELHGYLSFTLDVLHVKDHNRMHGDIAELKFLMERMGSNQISTATREWLKAPDVSVNHNIACTRHLAGTGLWFTHGDNFTTWATEQNSFLWINGFAGCGKTVLFASTIQHIFREKQQTEGIGVAFYYFSFSDETKRSDTGMLRSLLLQLSEQVNDGQKNLQGLRKLYPSGPPEESILSEHLKDIAKKFRQVFIFLDAIDECPRYSQREGVLAIIDTIRSWGISGLRLLITSRDEIDIREALAATAEQEVIMKNGGIDLDISRYISFKVQSDPRLQKWKEHRKEIENTLTKRAQGIFRYVECQLNELKRCPRNWNHLDRCLKSMPSDLDETYERMLCSIDECCVDDVRRILTMVCFSTRPLMAAELVQAHAVDLNEPPRLDCRGRLLDISSIQEICLGLIEIVKRGTNNDEETHIVQIAHFSVQEYLVSDRILKHKSAIFALQKRRAHEEISEICLLYLQDSGLVQGELSEQKQSEFPLATFAAKFWHHYYKNAETETERMKRLAQSLFHDQDKGKTFSTWVRLAGLDKEAGPLYYASDLGIHSIVEALIAAKSNSNKEMTNFIDTREGLYGSALQVASERGHVAVVHHLLEKGANVDNHGPGMGSALELASNEGHAEIVRMLLDKGANANKHFGAIGPAIQVAALAGHAEIVQILLDGGADVNGYGGDLGTALIASSIHGHVEVAKKLLQNNVDIEYWDSVYGDAYSVAHSERNGVEIRDLIRYYKFRRRRGK